MKYCTVCNTKYEDSVSFCPLDGEVLEDDPTSIVDSTLDGQYHIETMLGKGGMGAVYLARHILLGDRVAIKVLPPQMRNNAEWLRRFRREGQAARRFRHPNAVTVYDLRTTAEGMIYMVMEYVEGKTLDAELKSRGRFTPGDALDMLEPVMSVLNAAHAQGVVHRDLKPENIMIGKPSTGGEPTVKLLDLGIAKISELAGADSGGSTALTVAGQILGTPYYMSPEQWGEPARDNSPEVDGRADIYSLGTVFYELIAGQRPFTGLTLPELRRQHVTVDAKPLHEVLSDVSESFSNAVAKAMSKDRSDRQTTAGDLANELRAAMGRSSMSLTPEQFPTSSPDVASSSTGTSTATNADSPAAMRTGLEEGRQTGSDITAPTIMTVDSPPVSQPSAPPLAATSLAQPPPSGPPSSPAQYPSGGSQQAQPPTATIVTNPNAGATSGFSSSAPPPSFVPVQPQSQPYMPSPAARPAKKSPVIAIVIGVVLLLGVVGIGGGIFIYSRMGSDTGETNPPKNDTGGKETNNGGTTTAKEAMQYWLELDAEANPARVAAVVPLASGQSFKFHFTPTDNGYLYVVGPGEDNVPTTFLTSKPFEGSGVTSNSVRAGENFSFPNGDGNWITLDKKPGTEFYTVIFSKSQISSPAFFDEEAGKALSSDEKSELDTYLSPFKANVLPTTVINENSTEPYVSVKTSKSDGDTLVFDVRVEHK
jgi:serine/threonine protein kinase